MTELKVGLNFKRQTRFSNRLKTVLLEEVYYVTLKKWNDPEVSKPFLTRVGIYLFF